MRALKVGENRRNKSNLLKFELRFWTENKSKVDWLVTVDYEFFGWSTSPHTVEIANDLNEALLEYSNGLSRFSY